MGPRPRVTIGSMDAMHEDPALDPTDEDASEAPEAEPQAARTPLRWTATDWAGVLVAVVALAALPMALVFPPSVFVLVPLFLLAIPVCAVLLMLTGARYGSGHKPPGAVAAWAAALLVTSLPLAVAAPGVPIGTLLLAALVLALGNRTQPLWKDEPAVVAAKEAYQALRGKGPERRSAWRLALGWSSWWWLAVGVGAFNLAVVAFGAVSAVGGGMTGGGVIGLIVTAVMLIVGLLWASLMLLLTATFGAAAFALIAGALAVGPFGQVLVNRMQSPRSLPKVAPAVIQLLAEGLALSVVWLPLLPGVWPGRSIPPIWIGALALTPLWLALRMFYGPAAIAAGAWPGLLWLLKSLVVRPIALARGVLIGGAGLTVLTLLAWVVMIPAALVASPTVLLALPVHGIAWLAGASGGTHQSLLVLECFVYLLLCGVGAGRVLVRGLHAHGVYQVEFIRRLHAAS